jgi:hypothetical protein
MQRNGSILAVTLGMALCAVGCGGTKVLDAKSFEGRLMHIDHDFIEITNHSGHDLNNVNVDLTFFGNNGEKVLLNQHWDRWDQGELKKVAARDAAGKSVSSLMSAMGVGTATNYSFHFSLSPGDDF